MNILLILAHPDKNSFNHAIAERSCSALKANGHNVFSHDLYAENFNPILPTEEIPESGNISREIELHCSELLQSDGIIIIHPNWWGQPPAILKGWIDRVIRPGVAYKFLEGDSGEGTPIGLLKTKTAIVFNTSNTNAEREEKIFLDPLETIWKNCIFNLCGVKEFYRKMFSTIVTSTCEQRQQWLNEVEQVINEYFSKN